MGRPPSPLDDYREWQQRLERYAGSDLNLDDILPPGRRFQVDVLPLEGSTEGWHPRVDRGG